ncbi:MAG: LolA-related protein [Betaproteobacteria bacterium]
MLDRLTRRLKLAVLLSLLVSAFATTCADAQNADGWGLEQLMTQLGRVQRSNAHFVERKYMKVLKTPLELSGTLVYESPGRLVKRTLKPKPESMTVDQDVLTLERKGRERVLRLQDYPVLWAFVESIRSTLKGDLAQLQAFYTVALTGDAQRWQLSLTPKDPKMNALITAIQIGGGSGKVDTVEVREAKGDRSVMTIVEDPA